MSKESDLRAMREARFNARTTAAPVRAPRPAAAPKPADAAAPESPAAPAEGLCGHRSMSGRTCTREPGHDAKSHRYS